MKSPWTRKSPWSLGMSGANALAGAARAWSAVQARCAAHVRANMGVDQVTRFSGGGLMAPPLSPKRRRRR